MAPPPVSEAAAAQVRAVARLEATALAAGRRAWRRVDGRFISESWAEQVRVLEPVVAAAQVRAAEAGASYGAATLAEQGSYVAPDAFVNPAAFGGVAADGRSLSGLLYSPATTAKSLIGEGMGAYQALGQARGALDRIMRTTVTDAGRQAASVDIAARKGVGYVRMMSPPSCSRCVVLAGRSFRWNTGFLRHPRCDCVHVMSTVGSLQGAKDEGLISDPYEYFNGLSKAEQDRLWGANPAQAIRDGADIFQVTNVKRVTSGMREAGISPGRNFTTEGMGRRGNARQGLNPGQRRMTPDFIYRQAAGQPNPREFALDLLKTHGYVLPGGQNPLGSIVGQREGFGALGRGGTRKAASQAVLDARATGVRDGSRYTMTEAERRLYDAEQRWRMVQQGRNPYSSGFGNIPDPFGQQLNRAGVSRAPLTPKIAAQVETDYRRWLSTGGQKFVPSGAQIVRLSAPQLQGVVGAWRGLSKEEILARSNGSVLGDRIAAKTREVYVSGNRSVAIEASLTKTQTRAFLDDVASVLAKTQSTTGHIGVSFVVPQGDHQFLRRKTLIGGYVVQGQPTVFINPKVASGALDVLTPRQIEKFMPAEGEIGFRKYTITHELGHVVDNTNLHTYEAATFTPSGFELPNSVRDGANTLHREHYAGFSEYGKTRPCEGYAEAFAQWMQGASNPVADAYARRYGWTR